MSLSLDSKIFLPFSLFLFLRGGGRTSSSNNKSTILWATDKTLYPHQYLETGRRMLNT